ncbi:MAG: S-layer homology domain-containing protein [Pseudomonadota bacterium]
MKKNITGYFLFFLAVVFILSGCLPSVAYAEENTYDAAAPLMDKQTAKNELMYIEDNSYSFKDISKYWARDEILKLSYMDIIKGYDDGTMKPDRTISREEFVAMLVRAIGLPVEEEFTQSYKDVTEKNWSSKYIAAARENGLLSVFNGFYFYPYKEITREEMAVITSKAVRNAAITGQARSFSDIPEYYKYAEDIERVTSLGIITGLPDGSFNPKGKTTRAQAAVVIGRVLGTTETGNTTDDALLSEFTAVYENSVVQALSDGDYEFAGPLAISSGKEAKLNLKRAAQLKTQYQQGSINKKHMDNESFAVLEKSSYLAEIDASYELVFEEGGYRYMVRKTFYLRRSGDNWTVYNSSWQFGEDPTAGKKINLSWNYVWSSSVDMSNVKKVNGLNVISPTWFTLSDGAGGISERGSLSYSNWAHNNGYEVWALVDNKFDSKLTSDFLNDSNARRSFIDSLISYSKKYKLDGINVDFENMYTRDKNAFTQFVKELSLKTKANGLVLSVDVSVIVANSNWSEAFDRAALSKLVDYVALMAYDQHWDGSPVSGSVAQLSWVEQCVKRVLLEVPREKLLLGVPFYTRIWKEETVGSSGTTITSKAVSMSEAERTIAENNAHKIWDSASGQYYGTWEKGGATYKVWLEDENSMRLRAELVNKYRLGGIASWKYGLEKPGIWSVISETFNKSL